ncbi:MAG: hypothetical protein ACXVSX_22495 [Solirubrobacteraceae bacterium]
MFDRSWLSGRRNRVQRTSVLTVLAFLIAVATLPAAAGATVRVVNHNDPAGDATQQSYSLSSPAWDAPIPFTLSDGDETSFGPAAGTYTVQALPPAGWQVAAIECVGPRETDFVIDVPNGRVTMTHDTGVEQTCSFTIRRGPAPSGQPPSAGLAPSPPASELPHVVLPRRPALVSVAGGRGFAAATVRLTRRSVITGQLLYRGQVVGSTRVARSAGTHVVKVSLAPTSRRRLARPGRRKVMLTLRVVVAQSNGVRRVFRYRVVVRLV